MDEKLYFISEVSKMVGVEPHVLRYWEEELELVIQRNMQGKRCYTERDVERLCRIKYWKDKGMQLKAVKEVMEGETWGQTGFLAGKEEKHGDIDWCLEEEEKEYPDEYKFVDKAEEDISNNEHMDNTEEVYEIVTIEETSDSMQKLEQILDNMIGRALERNNEKLVREICNVIIQELDDKLEARIEELLQQELMREMLREGEREAAAETEKHKKGFLKRWKKWLEQYI